MRSIAIALALAMSLPLSAAPASAGLLGQTVTLNGTSVTIGSGVEFAGIDPSTRRSFTADFTDDGLSVVYDAAPRDRNGYTSSWAFQGASLNFSFTSPLLTSVEYLQGNISAPAPTRVPSSESACAAAAGLFCTGFDAVRPSFTSLLDWDAVSISLRVFPKNLLDSGPQLASFRIDSTPSPTPVPEPASLALFGIGVAGIALVRRKRSA